MAIPSGSGTEVLKRTTIHAQSNTLSSFRWDGTMATTGTSTYTVPAHHIITVISIVFNEQANTAGQFRLIANDGSNDIYFLYKEPITSAGTFVWNDRIVLTAGDKLQFNMEASGPVMDAYCSYIDQDWS